jgi:hypothetical protein
MDACRRVLNERIMLSNVFERMCKEVVMAHFKVL